MDQSNRRKGKKKDLTPIPSSTSIGSGGPSTDKPSQKDKSASKSGTPANQSGTNEGSTPSNVKGNTSIAKHKFKRNGPSLQNELSRVTNADGATVSNSQRRQLRTALQVFGSTKLGKTIASDMAARGQKFRVVIDSNRAKPQANLQNNTIYLPSLEKLPLIRVAYGASSVWVKPSLWRAVGHELVHLNYHIGGTPADEKTVIQDFMNSAARQLGAPLRKDHSGILETNKSYIYCVGSSSRQCGG